MAKPANGASAKTLGKRIGAVKISEHSKRMRPKATTENERITQFEYQCLGAMEFVRRFVERTGVPIMIAFGNALAPLTLGPEAQKHIHVVHFGNPIAMVNAISDGMLDGEDVNLIPVDDLHQDYGGSWQPLAGHDDMEFDEREKQYMNEHVPKHKFAKHNIKDEQGSSMKYHQDWYFTPPATYDANKPFYTQLTQVARVVPKRQYKKRARASESAVDVFTDSIEHIIPPTTPRHVVVKKQKKSIDIPSPPDPFDNSITNSPPSVSNTTRIQLPPGPVTPPDLSNGDEHDHANDDDIIRTMQELEAGNDIFFQVIQEARKEELEEGDFDMSRFFDMEGYKRQSYTPKDGVLWIENDM